MEYGKVEQVRNEPRKEIGGLVDSAQWASQAALAAEAKKGKDVRILDVRAISSITDYFVICSGTSTTHVRAIADNIEETLAKQGLHLHHMEGYYNGRWILLDYTDFVVHVMHEDEREYYGLERLWGDAREVAIPHGDAARTISA
jgi:ribosome-associated protein